MAHSSEPDEVIVDADGRLHHLVMPAINAGGQGEVFQTREPNIGVKVLRHGERDADIIRDVRRLPIEDLTSIAAPLSTLRTHHGYVMTWLRGMVPLGTDRLPSSSRRNEIVDWYIATGGLRRRLALNARLAEVMADLHGRGLVYVDLNLANVMVSDTGAAAEVRLIDLDNLRHATDQSSLVYTPGWEAPELHADRPSTRQSDAYSLALVAFTMLTGYHPFSGGDLVRYSPDDSPIRQAALRGEVPSSIDPDDTSNSSDRFLFPLDFLLTDNLLSEFRRTFGPGRLHPDMRPTAAELRRVLWDAHDRTIVCDCGFSTYIDAGSCASCDTPFRAAFAIEVLTSPSLPPAARVTAGSAAVAITRRHLPVPVEARSRHDEVVRVSVKRDAVVLEPAPEWSCAPRTIKDGDCAEIADGKGTSFTVRATAYAS